MAQKIPTTGVFDPTTAKFRTIKNRFVIKGTSDIVGIYKRRPLRLEVKTPKRVKSVTAEQRWYLQECEKYGAIVGVVTSIEDTKNLLEA